MFTDKSNQTNNLYFFKYLSNIDKLEIDDHNFLLNIFHEFHSM